MITAPYRVFFPRTYFCSARKHIRHFRYKKYYFPTRPHALCIGGKEVTDATEIALTALAEVQVLRVQVFIAFILVLLLDLDRK
jgi:hypothetical protein